MPLIRLFKERIGGVDALKLLVKEAVDSIGPAETENHTLNFLLQFLNGSFSIFLVLLGGLFAGLTLSFMGQDRVFLQVIAASGSIEERKNAQKVLDVLNRGRHWVLVTLLLGNVITNETLPIILDHSVKGGWVAVLVSTILIVIFGEVIPTSMCAKYGLAIGAWSSKYVLWVMYLLFPVAYPTAKLLDFLLGANHGAIFNRAGLKSLVMLHEHLNFLSTERLNRKEVALISNVLDLRERQIWSIMTPMPKLFTLSFDTPLNDTTRFNILKSGYEFIPVLSSHPRSFVGVLAVASLVALNTDEEVTIGQLALETLPTVAVRANASCQDIIPALRDRRVGIFLVSDDGTSHGIPFGIVTARDLLEVLIGCGESEEDVSFRDA